VDVRNCPAIDFASATQNGRNPLTNVTERAPVILYRFIHIDSRPCEQTGVVGAEGKP